MAAVLGREAARLKPKKGAVFSTVEGVDINGNLINTASLKGKILVINYWFIGCAPCRQEMPLLNKITEEYKDNKDVIFISIAMDKKKEIKKFLKKNEFKYQIISDGTDLITNGGILSFPTNIVVDREGKVQYISQGFSEKTPQTISDSIKKLTSQN